MKQKIVYSISIINESDFVFNKLSWSAMKKYASVTNF